MTKAEIKQRAQHIKLKIRKGDKVKIIAGKDKGEIGFVSTVLTTKQKVIILKENDENPDQPRPLKAAVKHVNARKARQPGAKSSRIRIAVPIHISNVMLIDPKTDAPTRIGRRLEDGKIVRFAKKSGEVIVDSEF